MTQRRRFVTHTGIGELVPLIILALGLLPMRALAAGPVDAPPAEVLAEAKRLVQEMINNSKGPYSRIRWYCNDGSVQPPVSYACRDHGGGRQHAEYSPQRTRLAELGWSVGTIFAPLTFESLQLAAPRGQRLRELPLERYLIDVDEGWVLRRAQGYRGRVQVENELVAGRRILLDAVTDPTWFLDNYLLVRELARVIPHGEDSDLSRQVRRTAVELAERDPAAERWRAEIHSTPSAATAGRLREWASRLKDGSTAAVATALADDLDLLYGARGRRVRLDTQISQLRGTVAVAWRNDVSASLNSRSAEKITGLCRALDAARRQVLAQLDAANRLALVSALSGIETEVQLAFSELWKSNTKPSRAAVLANTLDLLKCVYGSGLISAGEFSSVVTGIEFGAITELPISRYQSGIAQLKRVPGWAAGNVRYAFAEALVRYGALDSRAVRFTDDLLRGSPLWLLGDVLKTLSQDLAALTGSEVIIADKAVSSAIALNPGLARGRLRIYETLDAAEAAVTDPGDILALPETIAELQPVAGILTLGEGNALSHVQLLARNFGIPNVAIDFATIDLIKPLEGRDVILAVGSDGNVVLRAADEATAIADLLAAGDKKAAEEQITVPTPQLEVRRILPLAEIHRQLSGKVVGPKAANLGELNRLFPGRVAPALAIPFGIYAAHLAEHGLSQRIHSAYAGAAVGTLSRDALDKELADIRAAIATLTLSDTTTRSLSEAMRREFGPAGSYGVFVRSDTNVEDLPQFTGAGLSETLPNVTGFDAQLLAVPRVWASVLSPRALAWRSRLLTNPAEIYASVLLMKSVPSEKSGVLVTANLAAPGETALTVSTAWGVGGAVAGEAAESVVLKPDGSTQLISEAKTPYQRRLAATGGVRWVPAPAGRVLTPSDIDQLRSLAAEVAQKYESVLDEFGRKRPWDIEFGFVAGELTLFQIRPLVEKNTQRADLALQRLNPGLNRPTDRAESIDLAAAISGAKR